jgi:protein TonB
MRSPVRHWLVAVGAAVLIHAGLAAIMLRQSAASSARSAGIGGIEVSLGPAGGAAGAVAETETPVEKEEKPEEPKAQPEPPPVEQADTAMKEDKLPEPEPEPEPKPEPLPQPAVVPPPKPKPPVPDPPKKRAEPTPVPEKTQPREPEKQVAVVPPSVAGVDGKAGAQVSPNAGSANDTTGGGMPGDVVDYMAILQAWLEKHKEYPRSARLRRMEGTTLLYFVMDREGRVLDFRIQKSSGYELLDHEVEEMIRRAQPLPQMPDNMTQARLELVVPVQFLLR